ncbi:MAG: esterase-like activity of phytase family protein, partial [Mesorhizobium sp.]|nr:esterase-like activity of phytase family protein [Mesorhizobium sp.]
MSRPRNAWRRRLAAGLVALLAALLPAGLKAGATVEKMEIRARQITRFQIGSDETKFGPFEFVGGLELTTSGRDFGSMSAIRFLQPGSDFIGVTDTGFWFFGRLDRDADGRPSGFGNFRMSEMVDAKGVAIGQKWRTDAEGLAVKDGIATVSFERDHRVSEFRIEPDSMKAARRNLDFLVPKRELRQNRGFETVAFAHPYGIHEGGRVVVSEKSLDPDGNIYAAIIEGPDKGVFAVKRNGEFDITDGAFLPDGDLLLLERSFSMARGVAMRLRRIYGESVRKGAL